SEEHTSELQSPCNLVCRLLLEKKKPTTKKSSTKTQPPAKVSAADIESPLPKSRPLTKPEVCTTNRNAPPVGEYHWPADAEGHVYFVRGMFTPEQSAALLEAMKTWKAADQEIGSGVRFVYAFFSDNPATTRIYPLSLHDALPI